MARAKVALGALFLVAAVSAAAAAGTVAVTGAFAGATAGSVRTGAVYLEIHNEGTLADRLVAVRTPVAENAMIHESTVEDGVMTMRHVMELPLPPGSTVALAPGGMHVMLTGLHQPLKRGDNFPLTLEFAGAGAVEVSVPVLKPGARSAE